LLIGLVAVVVLAVGGGGAWFFLSHKKAADGHVAEAKPAHRDPPLFFTLEPFVVNLTGDETRYLQVGIDLKVSDNSVTDQIKSHLPEIRNGVLLLLSSKKPDDVATLEGKNQLREEIRDAVNRPLGIQPSAHAPRPESASEGKDKQPPVQVATAPTTGVLEVLLTSFVIQ
jgi:flagellar FliL protein